MLQKEVASSLDIPFSKIYQLVVVEELINLRMLAKKKKKKKAY